MKTVRTVAELHEALAELSEAFTDKSGSGRNRVPSVGMIPTMGALHEGHLSLVKTARSENDIVVMSVFVNPTQFNEAVDLVAYPRAEERDAGLAEQAGVDLLFIPSAAEMYPDGYATTVSVNGPLSETLEGARRGRGHFDGVATVVAKLLIMVLPDSAYFGQKDAQQVVVVRRMVRDLGIPTEIVTCPIVRAEDGLALSSRNERLTGEDRLRALSLSRSLFTVAAAVADGETDTGELETVGLRVLTESDVDVEYLAFVNPETLRPAEAVEGPVLCAVAARVGEVRLIDNVMLVSPGHDATGATGVS
ncbi:pantoate--beta-alanine ligase [Actinomycetaceae bacterium MB13-C1-2]|nr:pantoate--beta-alanine ligase [Actinomycetaceae bacterium MB13-C1-2]